MRHCNTLFDRNAAKVVRLAAEVKKALYSPAFTLRPASVVSATPSTSVPSASAQTQFLLSRWGHTVTSFGRGRAVVFGGYGHSANTNQLSDNAPSAASPRTLSRLHDLVVLERIAPPTSTSSSPSQQWRCTGVAAAVGRPPCSRMFHTANALSCNR